MWNKDGGKDLLRNDDAVAREHRDGDAQRLEAHICRALPLPQRPLRDQHHLLAGY